MTETSNKKFVQKNKWKSLRLSLKYRPKIMQLILKMRQGIRRRNAEIKSLKHRFKPENKDIQSETAVNINLPEQRQDNRSNDLDKHKEFKDSSTQTLDDLSKTKKTKNKIKDTTHNEESKTDSQIDTTAEVCHIQNDKTSTDTKIKASGWKSGENEKSIAEQVKQAALDALTSFEKKAAWNINDNSENEKSIAEQVKEVAQNALQQTGMVYVESAGMYYDYKTGYYYNSELGLYYHTDTNCYYYYSDEKQQFVFHSYPDTSAINTKLIAHQKKKARKQLKRERQPEDIDNLTKTLSQGNEDSKKPKRRKTKKTQKPELSAEESNENGKDKKEQGSTEQNKDEKNKENDRIAMTEVDTKDILENNDVNINIGESVDQDVKDAAKEDVKDAAKEEVNNDREELKTEENKMEVSVELEDGECSDSSEDDNDDDTSSNASTATVSDEDSIAKHHPPCMRVIIRETDLPKLKVGSLYLITKDGGTIGREGDQHAILIKDHNVSRNHLDVRYDMHRRTYVATDLGSKNGTILNGNRMSDSTEISSPMDVLHGSTIQLGETKLLCHIHPGNDTCGHCEPGLIMETEEKGKKAAYTRTCSVKKQHELELARLKNIYAPKLLEIEEKPYNDRAQARRETVGSSHHSVKTESTDLKTTISTENKGFKLLQKMGWSEGEGLGKDSQGETEPVPLITNDGKAGLGTSGAVAAPLLIPKPRPKNTIASATLRLAARTKMLQPPAKAFQADDDEDSAE